MPSFEYKHQLGKTYQDKVSLCTGIALAVTTNKYGEVFYHIQPSTTPMTPKPEMVIVLEEEMKPL